MAATAETEARPGPAAVARAALADAATAWSLGAFGAIAEFSRDADEPAGIVTTAEGGCVRTPRGALAVAMPAAVRAVAYEGLARRPDAWTQGVAFCLPAARAAMHRRAALTKLGPDRGALRPEDRDAVLFDMGLGALQVDVCVRTRDAALIAALRAQAGRNVLAPRSPAMAAIKAASPHRVFLSRLGRVEVYQPIPSPARGERTPDGPHTHVLPALLRHGRSHAATTPIPRGLVPCLSLHPPSPLAEPDGRARAFDRARFEAFQALLAAFAPAGYLAEKRRLMAAVAAGREPGSYRLARTRAARLGARVALRQLGHLGGDPAALTQWRAVLDRGSGGDCGDAD